MGNTYSNTLAKDSTQITVVAIANSAGLVSSNIFRAQDEPRYLLALIVSGALLLN